MRAESDRPIICIVGPTASGKTALAQRIATSIDAEIVSADSMQVYRGMDIGTGKIPRSQQLVAHHCLDVVNPGEPFSAALFQELARNCFLDIASRGKRVILCGGTGFYVRAAIDDYEFPAGEQVDNPIREKYLTIAREQGPDVLWKLLDERDSASAAIIPANDVKRVVRAFELLESNTTYAQQKKKLATLPQRYDATFIGLAVDPEVLAKRINARVDEFIELGLVDEVKGLLEAGFREGITAPQAIGYKEIVSYLDGICTLDEAVDAIKLATRRYAKRQRTWFRKDARIHWIDASSFELDVLESQALEIIKTTEEPAEAIG